MATDFFGRPIIDESSPATPDPRAQYDAFGRVIDQTYASPYAYNPNDPAVQQLNSLYKFNAPENYTTDRGYDVAHGNYGSWDLGNGKTLIPVRDNRYDLSPGQYVDEGTIGFLQGINERLPATVNPDGSFNPAGWRVADLGKEGHHQAMADLIGVGSVLSAGLGAYWLGPTGGVAGEIPAGSEGLMSGATMPGAVTGTSPSLLSQAVGTNLTSTAPSGLTNAATDVAPTAGSASTPATSMFGPSVSTPEAAFGAGGGTTAIDAASAAGAPTLGSDAAIAGGGIVPAADLSWDTAVTAGSGAGIGDAATGTGAASTAAGSSGIPSLSQLGSTASLASKLGSAYLQSKAIQDAAKTNAAAAAKAGQQQLAMYNEQLALEAPWRTAGVQALGQLSMGTQPGGELIKPFSTADMTNVMPAYTFARDQGLAAMQAQMARGGQNLSSNAIQGAGTLASGLASQYENQAFNQYQATQNAEANKLQSLAGIGQTAVGATNQNMAASGNNQAAATLGAANALAGGQLGSGTVAASQLPSVMSTLASIFGGGSPTSGY